MENCKSRICENNDVCEQNVSDANLNFENQPQHRVSKGQSQEPSLSSSTLQYFNNLENPGPKSENISHTTKTKMKTCLSTSTPTKAHVGDNFNLSRLSDDSDLITGPRPSGGDRRIRVGAGNKESGGQKSA